MNESSSFAVEFDPTISKAYKRNHASTETFTTGVGEALYRSEVNKSCLEK